MIGQVSRGSAGEYQAEERAGVAGLSWRVSGISAFLVISSISSNGNGLYDLIFKRPTFSPFSLKLSTTYLTVLAIEPIQTVVHTS